MKIITGKPQRKYEMKGLKLTTVKTSLQPAVHHFSWAPGSVATVAFSLPLSGTMALI